MNSEELEQSLRTEFESYLKGVLAGMRQEAAEFQSKIEAEFDKHRTQFDEAFKAYSSRFDADHTFDAAFTGSVAEHLRLARDEGARITADAMVEAEKLETATAPAGTHYENIRDAVNDISSKDSQSAILKALVAHAVEFAPRGAFFIIKNEHFAGWKVFGTDTDTAEGAIREIHFPTSSDSVLGAAVRSLTTVESSAGAFSEDGAFLGPLQFGNPDRMFAIPLVARGKGVAVLYADFGNDGVSLNREALETLVRVAGLTVELLASSQSAKAEDRTVAPADFENAQIDHDEPAQVHVPASVSSEPAPGFALSDSVAFQGGFPAEPQYDRPAETNPVVEHSFGRSESYAETPAVEEPVYNDYRTETYEPAETYETVETYTVPEPEPEPQPEPEVEQEVETENGSIIFDSGGSIEPAVSPTSSPFDKAVEEFQPAGAVSGAGFETVSEPASYEANVPSAPQPRLSDRPVDLPIEVPDEERRIHNDARRFARLLVSEIKLYNEKKVLEGRQAHDLYDRLREAIDRSRDMYDKRVQPPVAAKFDYFHYELLNSLADGEIERLGSSYPGASV